MGILSFFRFGRPTYANGNPGQVTQHTPDWGSTRSLPGVTIDSETATTISAVYRALQLTSSTIASFPVDVFEKQPDGSRKSVEYIDDTPIWGQPNHEQTQVEFRSIKVGHILLNGNAFVFVKREVEGYSFWLIEPERVEVARDEKSGQKVYRVDGDKLFSDFRDGGAIIHIPGWGRNGLVGVSPVRKMITALGLSKAAEDYAATYFGAGTQLGGVLKTDQKLTPEEAKGWKSRWMDSHGGIAKAHDIAVLSQGLEWQSTTTNPEDSQMTDVRQFQVAEVARIFGVPEHLIGSHDKTSSWGQGLEINTRAWLQFGLMPHITRIEQSINDNFLNVVNPDRVYRRYMKFNVGALMRGTNAERAAFYWQMFQMGVYTINTISALEDLPDIGEDGDVRFIPGNNLVPLDEVIRPDDPEAPKGAARVLDQVRQVLEQIETR